jgi:glutathione S-transferase
MSLILYYHPLSSFCWKALAAFYEAGVEFTPKLVNFGDPAEEAAFRALWPIRKFPLLDDDGRLVPEATIIIEHLALHHGAALIPTDPEQALEVRAQDRFVDFYLHHPMQRIIADRMRPEDAKDPTGVVEARALATTALDVFEARMKGRTWAVGDDFTMADCAALPALFYLNKVEPLTGRWPTCEAYLKRLSERPGGARTLSEAQPYFHMFPA